MNKPKQNPLLGAAFLMATSAIGPGFLTQTVLFTEQLLASFGFAILVSVVLDLAAQMNVWRVIAVAGKPAQEIANMIFPGLGLLLTIMIVFGGLAFNIGNIAGAGLGINVLFGIDTVYGAVISCLLAIGVFVVREAMIAMDNAAKILGFLMIGLTVYVAVASAPPLGLAVKESFLPSKIDLQSILTIVGGTVGGYITFAGAHRLLDAGVKGETALKDVDKSAITAIGLASLMRILLFLAALGVVMTGAMIGKENPAASMFQIAAGDIGYKMFGIVLWSAAITSVIGSAYTSVSFLKSFHPFFETRQRLITILFIVISTLIFTLNPRAVETLVFAGALNGLILPLALTLMLIAAHKKKIVGSYKHPVWMSLLAIVVILTMSFIGGSVIAGYFK